jgi:hypothetical protein
VVQTVKLGDHIPHPVEVIHQRIKLSHLLRMGPGSTSNTITDGHSHINTLITFLTADASASNTAAGANGCPWLPATCDSYCRGTSTELTSTSATLAAQQAEQLQHTPGHLQVAYYPSQHKR